MAVVRVIFGAEVKLNFLADLQTDVSCPFIIEAIGKAVRDFFT